MLRIVGALRRVDLPTTQAFNRLKEPFIDADTHLHQEGLLKEGVASLSRQAEELGFELTKKQVA